MEGGGSTRSGRLPEAVILALGLVGAAWVLGHAAVRVASLRSTITVTGSARQQIRSDMVVWRGACSVQSAQLQVAYGELQVATERVRQYLHAKGVPAGEIVFPAIQTRALHARGANGMETSTVTGYRLYQTVEVRSRDVDRVTEVSRASTELIRQGVEFESQPPEYLYTRLADLKVEMLAKATRDARARADEMARNSGSRIGPLRSARMGVFQITPAFSTVVSDYGINDTSSLVKDITAVVNMSFEIR